MKKRIKRIIKKVLEPIIQIECTVLSFLTSKVFEQLKWVQWKLEPQPEHFDHRIDLYYQWISTRNPLWIERGVFGRLSLQNGKTLELACGDGFNARNFYSTKSQSVIACDFDPKAIQTAISNNLSENIQFVLADIRTDMPAGCFDNIIWDAAIEHFTIEESKDILIGIKKRLKPNGILCGYTMVQRVDQKKSLSHHEYEFKNKEDLHKFISLFFKYVHIFETEYPERHNLYFFASDDIGKIPFSESWPHRVY
ncbi:MAG: class I SAM-dependent methyltransferase [Oligoflexia bacterium]|nr:class I SAM-dependent methyltransferase [Oligoflexia bacterium]